MEEYKNIIAILSEENFNSLVKAYVKDKYKADQVWICNGPYDGGKDLIAKCGDNEIKINFQITIQKSNIDGKIKDDVNKLVSAIAEGRTNNRKLVFFCSQHISQSKIDGYVRDAQLSHGIELDIFENYRLAELAPNYPDMVDVMVSVLRLTSGNTHLHLDKNQRLLLDYLATSYDASEVKASFIRVFILFRLYHDGPASVKEVFEGLKETFGENLDKKFVEGLVGRMKSKGFICTSGTGTPKLFSITDEHAEVIRKIEQQSDIDEATLSTKIDSILSNYQITDSDGIVSGKIVEFLGGDYDVDIYELGKPRNNGISTERRRIDSLKNVILQNSMADEETALEIVSEIISVGNEISIVEKCAVSKRLVGLYKSDSIERFLDRSERTVLYDTPVLLQRICNFLDELVDFDDYLFLTVKQMSKVIDESDIKICQFTTEDYLNETVHHMAQAYRLSRFLELPWISRLGKSKNVFYNYYLNLAGKGEYIAFDEFLKDTLGRIPNSESQLKKIADGRFRSILDECGIDVLPFQASSKYELTKNEYERILFTKGLSHKSSIAISNDVNAIIEIRELARHLEAEQGIPLNFITWDNSFYQYRQTLDENEYWDVVAPQRFADNLSIARFKVNPDSIGNPMLLYLSENMLSQEAAGFIDIINELYKGDRLKGSKLLNIIADLRMRKSEMPENDVPNDKIPIDEFLSMLLDHFKGSGINSPEFMALSDALQDDKIADAILDIIKGNIGSFKTTDGKLKPSIVEAFNKIIDPYKQNKEDNSQSL